MMPVTMLGMTKVVNDGTRDVYGKTLAVAFVLVFVAGILVTGSLRSSLVAVLPIAAAQGTVWMIMAVAGIKIKVDEWSTNDAVQVSSSGVYALDDFYEELDAFMTPDFDLLDSLESRFQAAVCARLVSGTAATGHQGNRPHDG